MGPEIAQIAIVGAGPRGISCLERLCASAVEILGINKKLMIHIIDPFPPGPGKVWRTNQPLLLLMNTVASQITVFTDESVECKGPILPGPSLHDWAAGESWLQLGPNDYPTRFGHGCYLDWAYHEICKRAESSSANVKITYHNTEATRLHPEGESGKQTLYLASGSTLTGLSAVILAQGHVPQHLGEAATDWTAHVTQYPRLRYFPPNNPADTLNLDDIQPNEAVFLQGLGLTFFDYMILLSSRRGGRFEQTENGLIYHSSGREPKIYAGSSRGIPHHARGDNEKGAFGRYTPVFLTEHVIASIHSRAEQGRPLSFKEEVFPLISKEVKTVYYKALFNRNQRVVANQDDIQNFIKNLDNADFNEDKELAKLGIQDKEALWSWDHIRKPQGDRRFKSRNDWNQWLLAYLQKDAQEAREGNVTGPLKAALDVLRDIRNEVRLIIDHHGVNGASYRDDIAGDFSSLNAFLSIGPPRRRIEEMVALMKAGVLTVIGPRTRLSTAPDTWIVESLDIPEDKVRVRTVIDAYVPAPKLSKTADPLLRYMLAEGFCRPHKLDDYETGGIDITRSPYNIIDRDGKKNKRCFVVGVPTEGVHFITAAGVRPCVNSVNLMDNDAVARAALVQAAEDLRVGQVRIGGGSRVRAA
ncbi:FAD-NAD(P)-binding-domain-containing protein [Podospora fimiseda]|uniref:FAD-NAD(P)-binding-domain-containing protein n=1 Tax=Podospora fimiseda TaxID=252190 RepID=A0AAN6YKP2_9PEZI|nr:FAD-NAD(P)-binding-domain-containing protein [Podospora fimiseda]